MKENFWQLLRYFLLWSVLPFLVALSFYGSFLKWEKLFKNTCYKIFASISFALLQSSCSNFFFQFRSFALTTFTQMPSLNRYEKVTCDNCGTQITKLNLARHKKSCSVGTLYCFQWPIFSTKSEKKWFELPYC